MNKRLIALGLTLLITAPGLAAPALAAAAPFTIAQQQNNTPFGDIQPLTPEQVKVQKYKMERLRIQVLRDDWFIVRGINETLDDLTLLKLTGRTVKVDDHEFKQTVGNGVTLGGLVLIAGGGLLLTDVIKFANSFWVGIGVLVLGGAAALGGQLWAGNISGEEKAGHILQRPEAEGMVKEYNEKLKKELGIEHVPNLDT